jgi:hypothetical protein
MVNVSEVSRQTERSTGMSAAQQRLLLGAMATLPPLAGGAAALFGAPTPVRAEGLNATPIVTPTPDTTPVATLTPNPENIHAFLDGGGPSAPESVLQLPNSMIDEWIKTEPLASQQGFFIGPECLKKTNEPFKEGQNGQHLVAYFDKGRMEINNPDANGNGNITYGLLVVDMMKGKIQTGTDSFQEYYPANIGVAGDFGNDKSPTYASMAKVSSIDHGENQSTDQTGKKVTASLNAAAEVGQADPKVADKATLSKFFADTGHNVPDITWQWMNRNIQTLDKQTVKTEQYNWLKEIGYPVSEPYWIKVPIGGKMTDIMVQAFQRQIITYNPNNKAPFNFEKANVGAHYMNWRYEGAGKPATPTPEPTHVVPPTATATPIPEASPSPVPGNTEYIQPSGAKIILEMKSEHGNTIMFNEHTGNANGESGDKVMYQKLLHALEAQGAHIDGNIVTGVHLPRVAEVRLGNQVVKTANDNWNYVKPSDETYTINLAEGFRIRTLADGESFPDGVAIMQGANNVLTGFEVIPEGQPHAGQLQYIIKTNSVLYDDGPNANASRGIRSALTGTMLNLLGQLPRFANGADHDPNTALMHQITTNEYNADGSPIGINRSNFVDYNAWNYPAYK